MNRQRYPLLWRFVLVVSLGWLTTGVYGDILFEREIPRELKERGEVIESPGYFDMRDSEAHIIAGAARSAEKNRSIFRVEVRRDRKGQLCVWRTRRGTVVFERNPGEDVLVRYALVSVSTQLGAAESDKTPGQIVADYRARKDEFPAMVRMDLVFDEKGRPYLHALVLDTHRDWVAWTELLRWREAAKERLACGSSFAGYELTGSSVSPGNAGLFSTWDAYGVCKETYRTPWGRWAEVAVVERQGGKVDLHTVLATVMPGNCRVEKTEIGPVVMSEGEWDTLRAGSSEKRMAWPSGDGVVVVVWTGDRWAKELLSVYGERFPSSLPLDAEIDRVKWAREEVDLWLSRWRKINGIPVSEWGEDRSEGICSAVIRCWLYVDDVYHTDASLPRQEAAKKSYETLARWWTEHREKTYWDDRLGKLVSKDYTPEHVQEARRKRAEEERRQAEAELKARLNEPLRDEQVAELRRRLIEEFTEFMKSGVSPGEGFEQVGEDAWDHLKQIAPKRTVWSRYSGPQVKRSRDLLYPLEGVFSYESPAGEKGERTYYYDRLNDQWVMFKEERIRQHIRGMDFWLVSPMEADRPAGGGEPAEAGEPGQETMPAPDARDDQVHP